MTERDELVRLADVEAAVEKLREEWRGSKGAGALFLALNKIRTLPRPSPSDGEVWKPLLDALYERAADPRELETLTRELDCCPGCDHVWHEYDTNASGCHRSENAEYCPNDLAEILRAAAKCWRAALSSTQER